MNNYSRLGLAVRHVRRGPEILRCMGEIANWWDVTSAYVGISEPELPLNVQFRSGTRCRLQEFYDIQTLWQIFFHRVYDVRPSDRVIIDAGANIGLFACYAAWRSPSAEILCLEPFPATFERLLATVSSNRLEKRIKCLNYALDDRERVAVMSATDDVEASQMRRLAADAAPSAGVSVRTMTLERLVDATNAEIIDLLKMDIEGSEFDVLLTTGPRVFRRIRRINVEYHQPPPGVRGSKEEIIAHLRSAGARLVLDDSAGLYGMLYFERSGCICVAGLSGRNTSGSSTGWFCMQS